MTATSRGTSSLLLALLLVTSACGDAVGPTYPGTPLVTLEGQMRVAPEAQLDGPVRLALAWYPRMLSDGTAALPAQPKAIVTEDFVYEDAFPASYRFHLYNPPPVEALTTLGGGLQGKGALGILLAYRDGNGNKKLDTIPATGSPVDRVVGASLDWRVAPAYLLIYLDSEQPPETGLKRGFTLVKVTDADTSESVPLSTPIPLALAGGPFLDALVCEAAWDGTGDVCGIDFDGEQPEKNALLVEGTVQLRGNDVEVSLLVTQEELYRSDAQVTLGGRVIPFTEEGMLYALSETDSALFSEGGTVELRVVSGGKELRRVLSLPGGFDLTASAPGGVVKSGGPLAVQWTRSAGAQFYNVSVETGDWSPLERVSTNALDYTFESVTHSGAATLRAEAVSWPQDNDRLGFLEVKVVRELPLTFEP
jgi:hypothetical protein